MTILAEGTIPAARAVIFATGASDFRTGVLNFGKVKITKITMFNNISTEQTIILSMKKKFGALRKLRQYILKINESAEYLEPGESLPLNAGDDIQAETTTADAVDFTVYGELS